MAIEVRITGRNAHISKKLRAYAEKKVGKLDHYLPELTEADLELDVHETARTAEDRQVAQLTLRTRGRILRAEERSADMFASIDMVLEKIGRQIERYKGKRERRWLAGRGEERVAEILQAEEARAEEDDEPGPRVVRRKQFELAPMNEEEAIEQMHLLGHEDFFVFYNADTAAINVLYQRKDGDYGLIEPEIA